jgi:hypothetical protein
VRISSGICEEFTKRGFSRRTPVCYHTKKTKKKKKKKEEGKDEEEEEKNKEEK